jgi:hypothetical protein
MVPLGFPAVHYSRGLILLRLPLADHFKFSD